MTTKRSVALAAVLLAAAATAADAKTVLPRREIRTASYVLPLYQTNQLVLGAVDIGGVQFKTPGWARYVSAVVVDDSGATMAFQVDEYTGSLHSRGVYCGQTPGWVPITPLSETAVTVNQGPCPDGSIHGVGLKGTVRVVFSDSR